MDKLVEELREAAKALGYEEGAQRDPDLHEFTRVDRAKAALTDYIAALKAEIAELGDVAKGCAKRESNARDALAIAQKRVNELEVALEDAAVELEDAADSFEAVKMKTCAACAAKASTEARAALSVMLKGNGDQHQLWRELIGMIVEWEDSCEPADTLARQLISKYWSRATATPTPEVSGESEEEMK